MARPALVVLGLLLASATVPLHGQRALPQETRQAILDYQLTLPRAEHLIAAVGPMTKYLVSLPDYQERMRKSMAMSIAERAAQMEKDPKAATILKESGLTARDYLVGVPALRMSLMAAQGVPEGPNIAVSPANLAFAKANLAQLKPKMDAVDTGRR